MNRYKVVLHTKTYRHIFFREEHIAESDTKQSAIDSVMSWNAGCTFISARKLPSKKLITSK